MPSLNVEAREIGIFWTTSSKNMPKISSMGFNSVNSGGDHSGGLEICQKWLSRKIPTPESGFATCPKKSTRSLSRGKTDTFWNLKSLDRVVKIAVLLNDFCHQEKIPKMVLVELPKTRLLRQKL
jgi:hypothetical protein